MHKIEVIKDIVEGLSYLAQTLQVLDFSRSLSIL